MTAQTGKTLSKNAPTMFSFLRSIFGLQTFDPQTMGEIAPAAWNAQPKAAKEAKRDTNGFQTVATANVDGKHFEALSKPLKVAEDGALEAPVISNLSKSLKAEASAAIDYYDLVELTNRKATQENGEAIKPLWLEGLKNAEIAQKLKLSVRTVEGVTGALSAAAKKKTANAEKTN